METKKIILFAVIAIVIVMMIGAGVYFFVFGTTFFNTNITITITTNCANVKIIISGRAS